MKKITILGLILLGLGFSPLLASADVIMPGTHPLDRCAKIVNLDKYPNISLIARITGPMVSDSEFSLIENDKCLSKGYKFNSLQVLVVEKDYIDSIGINNFNPYKKVLKKNILKNEDSKCYYESGKPSPCLDNKEDWYENDLADDKVTILSDNFDVYGGYVKDNNPLIRETVEYSIVDLAGDKIGLQKTKITSEFNNGKSPKVETFSISKNTKDNKDTEKVVDYPTNQDSTPVKMGFWKKIFCFFGIGKNC